MAMETHYSPEGLTALRQAEAEITAALKGPMPNLERALLVADRKDIRAELAKATANPSGPQ